MNKHTMNGRVNCNCTTEKGVVDEHFEHIENGRVSQSEQTVNSRVNECTVSISKLRAITVNRGSFRYLGKIWYNKKIETI